MLTILMPISGRGRAFIERGYTFPKPLIEIAGEPLIEVVVRNLVPDEPHRFVFVCRRDSIANYALADVLQLISPSCKIVSIGDTGGALCSALLGIDSIEADEELLIVNGDQIIDRKIGEFLAAARESHADGSIITFPSTHPKWSYVRASESNDVELVAEKKPISRDATAGIYYFRRGGDFLFAAQRMMLKGTRTANEYFVAPVFNELILKGMRISVFRIARHQMHSLGTPEDLESFTKRANSIKELTEDDAA
jgi:NDP-sugar pyrophosphorylase family protein